MFLRNIWRNKPQKPAETEDNNSITVENEQGAEMETSWVLLKSWHAIRLTRSIDPITLCGLRSAPGAEISLELPGAKSCENCLRILARKAQ